MTRRTLTVAAAVVALAAAASWWLRDDLLALRARNRVPRIILVTLDTLHVEHTGPYNPAVETTPVLDRFAREGVVFEKAYAPVATTLPSHTSLMTGLDPLDFGVLVNGQRTSEDLVTLAEILSEAGYHTGAVVSL